MTAQRRLFYHIFETAFGPSAIVYQDTPFQLTRVFLPDKKAARLKSHAAKEGAGSPGTHADAESIAKMIQNYFIGRPIPLRPGILDMSGLTPLHRKTLATTARIPFGSVRSYREIAADIGRPRAYRFVGTSMARNPFPIIIPCHRVIRSDGKIGQFGGGSELKRKMIELEKAHLPSA